MTMMGAFVAVLVVTPALALADGPSYGTNTGGNTGNTGGLPVTGLPIGTFVLVGLALLVVGTVLAVTTRKRAEKRS
jgi:uncharacterized protein with beta-barrel porin domain